MEIALQGDGILCKVPTGKVKSGMGFLLYLLSVFFSPTPQPFLVLWRNSGLCHRHPPHRAMLSLDIVKRRRLNSRPTSYIIQAFIDFPILPSLNRGTKSSSGNCAVALSLSQILDH